MWQLSTVRSLSVDRLGLDCSLVESIAVIPCSQACEAQSRQIEDAGRLS
jgi:hypothetical protein